MYTYIFPRFSQRSFIQKGFDRLGGFLSSSLGKVREAVCPQSGNPQSCPQSAALALTVVLFGAGCWGCSLLEVEFQYMEFLPRQSQLRQWFQWDAQFFPRDGEMGAVYLAPADLIR